VRLVRRPVARSECAVYFVLGLKPGTGIEEGLVSYRIRLLT
jgi:hypothetical protein